MTKAQIYDELRSIGYAKTKALALARKARPYTVNPKFFSFSDFDNEFVVNSDDKYILPLKPKTDRFPRGAYYNKFWEVLV